MAHQTTLQIPILWRPKSINLHNSNLFFFGCVEENKTNSVDQSFNISPKRFTNIYTNWILILSLIEKTFQIYTNTYLSNFPDVSNTQHSFNTDQSVVEALQLGSIIGPQVGNPTPWAIQSFNMIGFVTFNSIPPSIVGPWWKTYNLTTKRMHHHPHHQRNHFYQIIKPKHFVRDL